MSAAADGARFDADLSEREVQELSSADALAAFFARLGYDTNARTVQTPGNLGIGTEGTLRPIKRIELIADREGLFQVYLFELSSVTVSHTRALARAFRNRAGNFLLVLTSDYERLDFVLLERYLPPAAPGGSIGERQVGIRPRTLTVDRRNAKRRELRVLKRLTWTEPDGFAQHDKLLAAYSIADWGEDHFNNRALFSDYYLLERLREFPEWREDPKPAYGKLRSLYLGTFERFARKPVGELRKGLVEPALAALGFEARGGKIGASHETPDCVLHGPDGKEPLASLLVYPWARSLDGKDVERDNETPDENPGAIVVSLLEKNEVPWVIVTNGRLWRLYARQTHSRATNYYELDAEELLADTGTPVADPGEAFRYLWLLFRRKAFERHPAQREGKTQKLSLLDRLLLESEDYARELGSRLKDKVFEEVFPHLAHGFVEHVREQSSTKAVPQEELDTIYQGTLTLLYRLLFLLYAEARDLLPVREVRGFWEASLARMKKEIAENAADIADEVESRLKRAYRDDIYSLWERLQRLFAIVDLGDAALNVPFYNGGLFLTKPDKEDDTPEAAAARFLATHKVADRDLARSLDLLSRTMDEKRHSLVFIDYKSLGVRQLGSIYEGLLEFKVRIADEKLGVTKEKGHEIYASFSELDEKEQVRAERAGRVVKKGAVYLENDKRERKASGSYYTPDYIVEYIVEHAVGPMLTEKFDKMRPKLRKAQAEHKSFFERQKALAAKRIAPEPVEKAERIGEELVDELFDIKVLDPAMGSGHFLVEAVDFITDRMLTFLNAFPWNPVQAYLARMRDAILVEGESQGVTLDPAKLTDVNLLKRHVLKRCIYGVDLNPMAVELAKVSLWLDCFTLGAPLSFLDHHLRCGNSLIGITEEQFQESQKRWGQMDLLGGSQYAGAKMAVGAMIAIGALPDITPAQTRESRKQYGIAASALAPVKRLFDIYTSQWFGNEPRKDRKGSRATELNPALDFLRDPLCSEWASNPAKTKLPENFKGIAGNAVEASARFRFCHWELEFPEVFFLVKPGTIQHIELIEGAGFDAVIGNPPYGHVGESLVPQFFNERFVSSSGRADIYSLFFEQGLRVVRAGGRLSYITPNTYFSRGLESGLREKMLRNATFLIVQEYGKQVFEDAPDVVPVATVIARQVPAVDHLVEVRALIRKPVADWIVDRKWPMDNKVLQTSWLGSRNAVINPSVERGDEQILPLIHLETVPFGEITDSSACIGVYGYAEIAETGKYLSKRPKSTKWKPALKGQDLERYGFTPQDLYVHYGPWLFRSRQEKYFNQPKLMWQLIRKLSMPRRLVASLDLEGKWYPIANINSAIAIGEYALEYLVAIFNSRLMNYWYAHSFHRVDITLESIKTLPVKKVVFHGGSEQRRKSLERVGLRNGKVVTAQVASESIRLVDECTHGKPQRYDIAHDAIAHCARRLTQLKYQTVRDQKAFIEGLESRLSFSSPDARLGGIEAFTGKTRLKEFLGNYEKDEKAATHEEILAILAKNQRHFSYGPDGDSCRRKIKDDYLAVLATLGPVRDEMERLDKLIDALVYRLYGLDQAQINAIDGAEDSPAAELDED